MQNILSIDITEKTTSAVVVQVEGASLKILEKQTAVITDLFPKFDLQETAELQEEENPGDSEQSPDQAIEETEQQEVEQQNAVSENKDSLSDLLEKINTPWTNAVLIIPSYDYLSLNLMLPFSDSKNINKVLDLEVQDLVPFDISEFHIQHQRVSSAQDNHDIHVSLIPKAYMHHILNLCRQASFEPLIISTAASALGAAYHLAPDYLSKNSALVLLRDGHLYVCLSIDGTVRSDRIFFQHGQLNGHPEQTLIKKIMTELKLTLASTEKRYDTTVESVYLMGNSLNSRELQQVLGRNVYQLSPAELLSSGDEESGLAGIASIFAQDTGSPQILTNFRTRGFAYSPQLKELLRGLHGLLPYALAAIVLTVILMGVVFLSRESHIAKIEDAMQEQISVAIPSLQGAQADYAAVISEKETLDSELRDLGSPSQTSPLDAFVYVSQDLAKILKKSPDVLINELEITTSKIVVKVNTPSYKESENTRRTFERRRKIYCDVDKKDLSRSRSTTRSTEFTLRLCE